MQLQVISTTQASNVLTTLEMFVTYGTYVRSASDDRLVTQTTSAAPAMSAPISTQATMSLQSRNVATISTQETPEMSAAIFTQTTLRS